MSKSHAVKVTAMPLAEFCKNFKPAPFNPPDRTEKNNLVLLVESMTKYGFLPTEPVVVCAKNFIGDGHRRLAAARLAKVELIYFMRTEMEVQQYWALVNGTPRPASVKETGQAIAAGLEAIPPNRRRIVNQVLKVSGNDWSTVRAMMGITTPGMVVLAQRVAKYCDLSSDDEFIVRTMRWLAKYKMQILIRSAMKDGIAKDVLMSKIVDDAPIEAKWQ